MSNAKQISEWLNYPQKIKVDEIPLMESLANEYPFCLPLQYLVWQNSKEKASLTDFKQIYPSNPVLLHSWMHATKTEEKIKIKKKAEAFELPKSQDYFNFNHLDNQEQIEDLDFWKKKDKKPETLLEEENPEQSLMVVMSFSEWLVYLDSKIKRGREEEESQKALRAMWQKQRLAEVMEEEGEEIPEQVFEMAVKSILPEEELISETLASVFAQQGKKDKAIEMYKKLSLQIPEKNGYFAQKIKNLQKEI